MLTKFAVTNFKNFKETFVFELIANRYEFNAEAIENGIVKKAIIYGANGCGKSNLGFAIFELISHLTDKEFSHEVYNRNYLNAESKEKLTTFCFNFDFDGSKVEYRYSKKAIDHIVSEVLTINNKDVIVYNRGTPVKINLKGAESLNTDLTGSKLSALKYVRNNTVLDSRNKINKLFNTFFSFVDKMLFFRSLDETSYIGYEKGARSIIQDILKKGHLKEFEHFLNTAGIICQLTSIDINGQQDIAFNYGEKAIPFLDVASTGTRSLGLFYFWLQRLKASNEVSFVFIDEFDAFYHHNLSALIVNELKKLSCQVILTTHNTSIMSNELLRPDCYFIMKNNQIKPLHQLTDKELRSAHNIEKMYKASAFNV